MTLELWLVFIAATALLVAVPGPTVLLVSGHALAHGFRPALCMVAAILFADVLIVAVAFLGIDGIHALSPALLALAQALGAGYLVYLGTRCWRRPAGGAAPAGAPARHGYLAAAVQGFTVTLLNPKSFILLSVFFTQFIDPAADPLPQLLVLGTTFLVVAGPIALAYAGLADAARRRVDGSPWLAWANRLAGGLLIAAGLMTLGLRLL